jgi:hypothetical protein
MVQVMNAPARLKLPRTSPSEELVALFVPLADEKERGVRARVHFARDQANARSERSTSPESHRIYSLAASIASDWVFRHEVTIDDLNEVVVSLQSLFLVAARFDRIEKAANARG